MSGVNDDQSSKPTESGQKLDLSDVRREIDAIDVEIQALLNARASAALKVAEVKLAEAQGSAVDFYRPEREAQILRSVADRNEGPMGDKAVQRIFREIISASLALEEPMGMRLRLCQSQALEKYSAQWNRAPSDSVLYR